MRNRRGRPSLRRTRPASTLRVLLRKNCLSSKDIQFLSFCTYSACLTNHAYIP